MTRRVRDRATFQQLGRVRARRAGTITLRCVPARTPGPPQVAYAVSRRVGNAVGRNRVRRRLRAAVRAECDAFLPGRAYLIGASPATVGVDFETLRATLRRAARDAGEA